jgi:hypothetical protein
VAGNQTPNGIVWVAEMLGEVHETLQVSHVNAGSPGGRPDPQKWDSYASSGGSESRLLPSPAPRTLRVQRLLPQAHTQHPSLSFHCFKASRLSGVVSSKAPEEIWFLPFPESGATTFFVL